MIQTQLAISCINNKKNKGWFHLNKKILKFVFGCLLSAQDRHGYPHSDPALKLKLAWPV